jgi:aldose 1-epimerase
MGAAPNSEDIMLALATADLSLTLAPETGGAITRWTRDEMPLLRPVADPDLGAQRGVAVASYPLVPFCNRIAWGCFQFGGADFCLERNFGDHPHPLHGNGWMHPWRVEQRAADWAILSFDHAPPRDPAGEWPFSYRAEQVFHLDAGGLTVTLTLENRDVRPMPGGIGLHPFVARDPETELSFVADAVWRNGPDALPETRLPVGGHWDFSIPRRIGDAAIDECYAGWHGAARIWWPERGYGLAITAGEPFGHLQLYAPPGRDYLGIEPVSHMTDAINRPSVPGNGLRVLAPGERLAGTVRFSLLTA